MSRYPEGWLEWLAGLAGAAWQAFCLASDALACRIGKVLYEIAVWPRGLPRRAAAPTVRPPTGPARQYTRGGEDGQAD